MGVVDWLVLLGFFSLMLVGYNWGYREESDWGRPVFFLAFIALVGWTLWGTFGSPAGGSVQRAADAATASARALGNSLRDDLPDNCKILFLCPVSDVGDPDLHDRWKNGLAEGLGRDGFRVVDCRAPDGAVPVSLSYAGSAMGFSKVLEGLSADLDAVISFTGLPSDLPAFRLYRSRRAGPVVAAYVGKYGDRRKIRRWLEEGYLQAVALTEDGEMATYDAEHLPPLDKRDGT